MSQLNIAISGINAAQRGIEVVGNNIANAATEGYSRQEIRFNPAASVSQGGFVFGQGVEIGEVRRVIDKLLENEITRQYSAYNQYERELSGLQTLESNFAELNSNSLSDAMDEFFQSITEFAIQPQSQAHEDAAIGSAVSFCNQMNNMGDSIVSMQESIANEAAALTDELNQLCENFAYLNSRIIKMENGGVTANDLRNERDQLLSEIAELVDIKTAERDNGAIDISIRATGEALVSEASSFSFTLKPLGSGELSMVADDADQITTEITGGKLGGLFSLSNNYLSDIRSKLDSLASTVINEFNKIHLQGVGTDGSFDSLHGWKVSEEALSEWADNITVPGKIYFRVTDTAANTVQRYSIDVDGSDTVNTIAAKLNAAAGDINAYVSDSTLSIKADTGYKFDFLPGVLSEPTTEMATGTSNVKISGIYAGSLNQTYTATISGSGEVGVDSGLEVTIVNQAGDTVGNFDIGLGYIPGSLFEFDGLKVSFELGSVVDGENFTIQALANSDETGFLAAAGINSFFEGNNATSMKITREIAEGARSVATSVGLNMNEGENLKRLSGVYDESFASLNNSSIRPFYQRMITDIGQTIKTSQIKYEGLGAVLKNLNEKKEEISGVDVNTEATKLMMFEQMFQAMSKYLSICKQTMDELAYVI